MSTASSAAGGVGGVTGAVGPPTTASGIQWIAGFGIFSFIMVMGAESEKYGEIAVALTWLIAIGATVYWWNSFDQNLAQMIGSPIAPATGTNTPQGTA